MPFTLTMPKMSPTMEEGAIAKWLKKEGDYVEAGEALLEIATDKATVEYTAIDSGFLRKILKKEGQEAPVNYPIAIFTEGEIEVIDGYIPEGETQKIEEKVTGEQKKKEKPTNEPLLSKTVAWQQPEFVPESPLENYTFESPAGLFPPRLFASPLAKKIAKEKGLNLSTVKGTGPHQRIMSRDLARAQPAGIVSFGNREIPQEAPGTFEEENLTPMRKVIAQRLQESKSFIPHFYIQQTVDAGALVELREQLKKHEIKPSINDFLIRASALALRKHPRINSGFNSVNHTIVTFKTIDISVAVSLPTGLITPIIRHADFKNVGEISVEVKELAQRGKEGKLLPEEYKGGSFTISNLGMYGVSTFTAIINPPQSSILAVGGILEAPLVKNGQIIPGKVMNLTLSSDHRVIDGVAAAEFLTTLKYYLENPAILLI